MKLRVFISSVQKELEIERTSIASLILTDPFLNNYLEPVLFDKEPITGKRASKPYLDCLDTCHINLLMLNNEYGRMHGSISATHHEYRHSKKKEFPILVFIKGQDDKFREAAAKAFIKEIKADDYTYKRFYDRLDLRKEVRESLLLILKKDHGVTPSAIINKRGEETLEASSPFEAKQTDITPKYLDINVAKEWLKKVGDIHEKKVSYSSIFNHLRTRGLLWKERDSGKYFVLAAGIIFLGKNPSTVFPHCRIMADAYRSVVRDSNPNDQATVIGPAPKVIEQVLSFIKRNTRHPSRVVRLKRIVLDEYPDKVIREAVVNAIAHREYTDTSRQIIVEVFYDKVSISSPGAPPQPLTLSKLRKGNYRSCSRNPVVAHSLFLLDLMEQRGSGFAKMKTAMLDHGLEAPEINMDDGYFQVVLHGPGDDLDCIRIPEAKMSEIYEPSIENQLNDRQKKMTILLAQGEKLTSRFCEETFNVSRDTTSRDFKLLIELDIAIPKGKGRSRHYVYKGKS